ncbi:MAG: hypothetical protein Q9195_003841 [Heterodermia aff. obscurata]
MSNTNLADRFAAAQTRIASLEAEILALQSPQKPSILSIAVAATIAAALGSYFYSQAKNLPLFRSSSPSPRPNPRKKPSSWPNSYDVTVHPDSSDEELMRGLTRGENGIAAPSSSSSSEKESDDSDDEPPTPLSTFPLSPPTDPYKLTLLIRTDLSMTRGKIAAQASHATLANYRCFPPKHPVLKRWEDGGQAKIALQVKSEEEIWALRDKAVGLGLCARVVRDAGRTQVEAGSVTCLAVGPGPKGVVDEVTGGLRLL